MSEPELLQVLREGQKMSLDQEIFRIFQKPYTSIKAGLTAGGVSVLEFTVDAYQVSYSIQGVIESNQFWHGFLQKELASAGMFKMGFTADVKRGQQVREKVGDDLLLPFLLSTLYRNPLSGRSIENSQIKLLNTLSKRTHKFPVVAEDDEELHEESMELAFETVNEFNSVDPRCVRTIFETISKPLPALRDYQERILSEIMDEKSSLVILPTGAGKTRLFMEYLARLKGRHYVVVPTVALVEQMEKEFANFNCQKNLHWKVQASTGSTICSLSYDIFIGTPISIKANLTVGKGSCIIFDEVHNLRGESIYAQILSSLENQRSFIKILGLTASIGFSFEPNKIEKEYSDLTSSLQTEKLAYLTEEEKAMWEHLNLTKEINQNYNLVVEKLQFGIGEFLSFIKAHKEGSFLKWLFSFHVLICDTLSDAFGHTLVTLDETLQRGSTEWFETIKKDFNNVWAEGQGCNLKSKEVVDICETILGSGLRPAIRKLEFALLIREAGLIIESLKISESSGTTHDDLANWHYQNETILNKDINFEAFSSLDLLRQMFESRSDEVESPVLLRLTDLLQEKAYAKKTIIFCELRITVLALCNFLESQGYENVLPYSRSVAFGLSRKFSETSNKKSIRKSKYLKNCILVTTSAIEEGIDVPDMEVVIRLDPPNSLKSHIQGKGRARMFSGEAIGFQTNKTNYVQIQNAETQMSKMIASKLLSSSLPKTISVSERTTSTSDYNPTYDSGKEKDRSYNDHSNFNPHAMLSNLQISKSINVDLMTELNRKKQMMNWRFEFRPVSGGYEGFLLNRNNDVIAQAVAPNKPEVKLQLARKVL